MGIVSNLALVDTLQQTGLINEKQVKLLRHKMHKRLIDARTLARLMLKHEWLTVFQINELLEGNGRNLVVGPYHILDKLGQGGQSSVYKARHSENGWIVALKLIKTECLCSPEASEQFMQEMEAMASLRHTNIVQFYDADKVGDNYYCALEYVAGNDLGKHIRLNGPLPIAEACDYIRQTALGLEHAFERNLIHRDIKPVNLILSGPSSEEEEANTSEKKFPTVKILDWGLAGIRQPKSAEEAQLRSGKTKSVIGTADYLSPEQAMNPDEVDIRGDIYSLGCTFYFLLTGQPPFPEGTLMQKIIAHQKKDPTPVQAFRSDLPIGLEKVLIRMMAKKPEHRYQTPGMVATSLKPFTRSDRFLLPRMNKDLRSRLGLEPKVSAKDNYLQGKYNPELNNQPTISHFKAKSDTYTSDTDTPGGDGATR